jgi:hypothetical protein
VKSGQASCGIPDDLQFGGRFHTRQQRFDLRHGVEGALKQVDKSVISNKGLNRYVKDRVNEAASQTATKIFMYFQKKSDVRPMASRQSSTQPFYRIAVFF